MPARAHVVLPEDLIEKIDQVAGRRRRSRFVESAIREKLARETLTRALEDSSGAVEAAGYAEWATPELTSQWVAERRRADEQRQAGA